MRRHGIRGAGLGLAVIMAAFALAGCQDVMNSLFDTAAPTGLSASDGDYENSVHVSWGAPNLSSEKWIGYSTAYFVIEWSSTGGDSGSEGPVLSTSYPITVSPAYRAQYYDVTVTAFLNQPGGGVVSGGSESERGFALEATTDLVWPDGAAVYNVADGEQWYVTMLQEGFSYSFDFDGANIGDITFYPYRELDIDKGPLSGSMVTWLCDSGGAGNKFYVRVRPSVEGTDFTASCDFGF